MEVFAVFRGGKWIEYSPRAILQADPRITNGLKQKAASAYVTASQKGFLDERAHMLAETIVFKDLYKEIEYEKSIEADLKVLKDRGGTA